MNRYSLLALAIFFTPFSARADYVYQFSFTEDGIDAPTFSGLIGDRIEIPVYLVEMGTRNGGPAGLADGLQIYGASFDFQAGSQLVADINPVDRFDGVSGISGPSVLLNRSPISAGPGVEAIQFSGGHSAFLGTLDVTLTTLGDTTIDLLPYSQGTSEGRLRNANFEFASQVLINVDGISATLVAVPEPSSVWLMLAAGLTLTLRRQSRGKAS